jgi:hypothetical protein
LFIKYSRNRKQMNLTEIKSMLPNLSPLVTHMLHTLYQRGRIPS